MIIKKNKQVDNPMICSHRTQLVNAQTRSDVSQHVLSIFGHQGEIISEVKYLNFVEEDELRQLGMSRSDSD